VCVATEYRNTEPQIILNVFNRNESKKKKEKKLLGIESETAEGTDI
jgi:hypothetical protein